MGTPWCRFLAVLPCLIVTAFGSTARAQSTPPAAPEELLVGLRPGAATALADVGEVLGVQPRLNVLRVRLRPGLTRASAVGRLRGRAGVLYVEPNRIVRALATPNDPSFGDQYGPQRVQADLSWGIWQPSAPVVLAVVDTGVDHVHPDLFGVIHRNGQGQVVSYNSLTGTSNAGDDHGHGTHVAGVAAAHPDNGIGIAGIAGWSSTVASSDQFVRIMPIKVLDADGNGTDASVADGIVWAVDQGAKVVNLSLGVDAASITLDSAIQYAWSHGAVVVAAAGNSGVDQKLYPAAFDHVISVAATDPTDTLTDFSQYGAWVLTAAPGSEILSALPGGFYFPLSGTSMACPHVAGEAAAILAQNPTLSNQDVTNLILAHVDSYRPLDGRKLAPGAGRINVFRGVEAAGTGAPELTSLTLSPPRVLGGLTATGTVFLGGPAPAAGIAVTLSSSHAGLAAVPASVTVPTGAASATFTVTTTSVATTTTVTLTATEAEGPLPGARTRTAQLDVRAIAVDAVSVSPDTVTGGNPATGTVTLNSPAPAGGAVVSLASSAAAASVPASVTVPAGDTTATFAVSTQPVAAETPVTLSATFGGETGSATLTVLPPAAKSVTLSPTSIVGGRPVQGTVTLSGPAPLGGLSVSLSTDTPSLITVPAAITVPEGAAATSFNVTTAPVTANTTAKIMATAGGTTRSASLTLLPLLGSLRLSVGTVTGGIALTGTVTLNAPAPAGGSLVALGGGGAAVTLPASVTVAEGATTGTFDFQTHPVSADITLTLTASLAGTTRTATLLVKSPRFVEFTLAPARVVGGASVTGTLKLTGPAPTGGMPVTLSSDRAIVTPPASVTVPEGSTKVTFSAATTAVTVDTPVTLTALGAGSSRTAGVTVEPLLESVRFAATSVTGGKTTSGTVTLNGAAPAGGAVVSLSISGPEASVPVTVTVPAGSESVGFPVMTSTVATDTVIEITASLEGVTRTDTLTITPPVVASVILNPTKIVGGATTGGTVTLDAAAPVGGLVVTLASSSPKATVPALVTVPGASTSATFSVNSSTVTANTSVTVTATTSGVSRSATLTLQPLLASVRFASSTVVGGSNATGTVTLNAPAGSGGALVSLSSNSGVATAPPSVSVATGATTASFTVTTSPVTTATPAVIAAELAGTTQSATLTVTPPGVASVALQPGSVVGGSAVQGTVTLTGVAPDGGVAVALSTSNTTLATVPGTVTVPEGSSVASFSVGTAPVTANTSVSVTASLGGGSRSANLSLLPLLASVRTSAGSVTGGTQLVGTVTLNAPAPAGGSVVALTSDDSVVEVPASVTVPGGLTTASFPVTTDPVAASTTAVLTAELAGASRSATLVVLPPQVKSVSLSPSSLVGGLSAQGVVSLTGPAPAGGLLVNLGTSNSALALVPSDITVPEGASSAGFPATTSSVSANASVSISATTGSVSRSATLTLLPWLASVKLSSGSTYGGASLTGTVILNDSAPAGGLEVALASSDPAASVPAGVTVAAGSKSATFPVATSPVASDVILSVLATAAGTTRPTSLTIRAPVVTSLTLNPNRVVGGIASTGTAKLVGPAPTGGTVVVLTSNMAAATAPATVTVPAGATTATFTVTTSAVASQVTAILTAATGSTTRAASLTLTP